VKRSVWNSSLKGLLWRIDVKSNSKAAIAVATSGAPTPPSSDINEPAAIIELSLDKRVSCLRFMMMLL
jgi:hypothetical protein